MDPGLYQERAPSPCTMVNQCRLCRSTRLSTALALPSTPPANAFQKTAQAARKLERFPLYMLRCSTCGHHQLSCSVDPKVLFSDYVYASGTSAVFRAHFEEYARTIRRRTENSGLALELGSNDGTMLQALRDGGFSQVLGVEPANGLAERANERGLHTLNRFFGVSAAELIREEYGCADVWTANNVLAHVPDFVGTLQALHHCTKPNTLGVFEVQYLASMVEGGMFDLVYHEHLDYWLLTELVRWLPKTTGWSVFDVQQIPTHGGSLRVWLQSVESMLPLIQTPAVETLVRQEAFHDWASRVDTELMRKMQHARLELMSLLPEQDSVTGQTGTVAYGAPAKLCTLVEAFGLANRIDYVVDDSPLKMGLFAPGSGLEVRSPTVLNDTANPPKRVLITAWNFADSIVKKLRDAGLTCPIIVPFPQVRVL